jgi:hypothetical protein
MILLAPGVGIEPTTNGLTDAQTAHSHSLRRGSAFYKSLIRFALAEEVAARGRVQERVPE